MVANKKNTFCLFLILYGFTMPGYAYLDPGTGNILMYAIISILGSAIYVLKGISYKLLSALGLAKSYDNNISGHQDLMLFSEGKSYWFTFKPVIEALIEKKQPFTYFTMDIEDPALEIENDYMDSYYVGSGLSAFAKVCNFPATVMLATTPNIGTPGYPMPVPKYVKCMAHILHGVGDVGTYHKYSLDEYHAVLTMNDAMIATIRHLEHLRHTAEKECYAVGMPYFDELASHVVKKSGVSQPAKILIAPSWGSKGCLSQCGAGFIISLAKAGFDIIVRPHPQTIKSEAELLTNIQQQLAPFSNVAFDFDKNASIAMNQSDLLISDKSGIRFDYAFLYERPVVTLDIPIANQSLYELDDLTYIWEDDMAGKIGTIITMSELGNITQHVNQALLLSANNLIDLRNSSIAHLGHSGQVIADWASQKCQDILAKNITKKQ